LTAAGNANVFFSHDEYVDFYAREEVGLSAVHEWLSQIKYPRVFKDRPANEKSQQ
jgi:hypothetical protein